MKEGPFYSTLEKSLDELGVKRQAYQGGTFVGNHVHKLLKVILFPTSPYIHNILTYIHVY